jgi:hypothetical protein
MCFRYFGEALVAWLIHNEGGDTMETIRAKLGSFIELRE